MFYEMVIIVVEVRENLLQGIESVSRCSLLCGFRPLVLLFAVLRNKIPKNRKKQWLDYTLADLLLLMKCEK